MKREEFERLYLGVFEPNGDWPEVEKEKHQSGIYAHKCPNCGIEFGAYKRRLYCKPCDEIIHRK